jgi:hypothetical protein
MLTGGGFMVTGGGFVVTGGGFVVTGGGFVVTWGGFCAGCRYLHTVCERNKPGLQTRVTN